MSESIIIGILIYTSIMNTISLVCLVYVLVKRGGDENP